MSVITPVSTKRVFLVQYDRMVRGGAWRRRKPETDDEDPTRFEQPGIEDLGHDGDQHVVRIRVADTDAGYATTRCDRALLEMFGGEIMEQGVGS